MHFNNENNSNYCLKYNKQSTIPNDGGEPMAIINVGVDAAVANDATNSKLLMMIDDNNDANLSVQHGSKWPSSSSPSQVVCRCKTCRTEYLTTTEKLLTLCCHYCNTGFLVRTYHHNDHNNESYTYICIQCGIDQKSNLPFITKLYRDLQEEILYWQKDFNTRDDSERALIKWNDFYLKLIRIINKENLTMVHHTVQLAKAFIANTNTQNFQRAYELNRTAIESLIGYEVKSVVDKTSLNICVNLIEQNAQQQAEHEVLSADYVDEIGKMKAKIDELEN